MTGTLSQLKLSVFLFHTCSNVVKMKERERVGGEIREGEENKREHKGKEKKSSCGKILTPGEPHPCLRIDSKHFGFR